MELVIMADQQASNNRRGKLISTDLWPGDNSSKKINMLAPVDGQSIKTLFWVRAIACGYFTFHCTLVVIVTYDEFWKFLTNLTYIMAMISYHFLFWAHCKNQDYKKSEYRRPDLQELE